MRLEKSACQVLRLYRPSFNVDDEKDFRTQQPAAVRKIQVLAILGDDEPGDCKPRRDQGPREREEEKERRKKRAAICASRITLVSTLAISVEEESRDAFENHRPKQW